MLSLRQNDRNPKSTSTPVLTQASSTASFLPSLLLSFHLCDPSIPLFLPTLLPSRPPSSLPPTSFHQSSHPNRLLLFLLHFVAKARLRIIWGLLFVFNPPPSPLQGLGGPPQLSAFVLHLLAHSTVLFMAFLICPDGISQCAPHSQPRWARR